MFSKHIFSNICLVVASLIWGTAFVAQTTGMDHIGPLTFTNIRFLIGGLIVFPLAIKEITRFEKLLKKKQNSSKSKTTIVKRIIGEIKRNGDKALIKYEKKYCSSKMYCCRLKVCHQEYPDQRSGPREDAMRK